MLENRCLKILVTKFEIVFAAPKNETEVQTRLGILPRPGDEIATILHGAIVKGRVTVTTTNPSPEKSHPDIEVRVEEI
jgi:hypothetical protein